MSVTSDKLITAGSGISIAEISNTISDSSTDLGTLCTSVKNNEFSKKKPINIVGVMPTTSNPDSWEVNKYGVNGTGSTGLKQNQLYKEAVDADARVEAVGKSYIWEYPQGATPYYRILDYDNYFHGAPVPFRQANGTEVTVDMLLPDKSAFFFYFFMTTPTARFYNRNFVRNQGIGSGSAIATNRTTYCMGIEQLYFLVNGSYKQLVGGRIGVVVYPNNASTTSSSNPITSLFADASDAIYTTNAAERQGMYVLNLSNLTGLSLNTSTGASGVYKAVPCVIDSAGSSYMLPSGDADYPNVVTLKYGGLENYRWKNEGISESSSGPFYRSDISITGSDIYISIRFYNNNPLWTINVGPLDDSNRLVLQVRRTGSVSVGGGTPVTTFDNGQPITFSMSDRIVPSSNTDVTSNSSILFTYKLTNVLNPNRTQIGVMVDPGSYITLTFAFGHMVGGTLVPIVENDSIRQLTVTKA